MKKILLGLSAVALGLAAGIYYAWVVAPVKYVDATPALLRADFKDQYRIVIAASYASTRDLARARARLELLGDSDSLAALKAQAQRMVGGADSESIQLLAQMGTDMEKGAASVSMTNTPPVQPSPTATLEFYTPPVTLTATASLTPTITPTFEFIQTPFNLPEVTPTPRPTLTARPNAGALYILVGQETVCDSILQPGLLQIRLADVQRRPISGVKLIITSTDGTDITFTGFKSELGYGYADFLMKENMSYSIRVGDGGTFVANLSAPACTDSNGMPYWGGLSLSFQQP